MHKQNGKFNKAKNKKINKIKKIPEILELKNTITKLKNSIQSFKNRLKIQDLCRRNNQLPG